MRWRLYTAVPVLSLLLGLAGAGTALAQSAAPDEFPLLQHIYVSDHCQVLTPETNKLQSNPDVCHFDGMGVSHSSHVAAKEVDGTVQHSRVDISEQTYMLQNIHSQAVVFVVAQQVPEGWHIDSDPQPKAINGSYAIFYAVAQPGQIVQLHVGMAHESPMDDPQ